MLQADGDADQPFGHAGRVALGRRHARVRGRGRMADQRFGAAQAHRRLEQAQRVDEAEGLGAAAVQHEGEGRARAAALALYTSW